MKVFLSYSSVDDKLALRLASDLRSANVDVWLDQWNLEIGQKFEQKIKQNVDEADFVIVLLTRASVSSMWVNREWNWKVHNEAQTKRISVIPVRGEPCKIPDFLAQRSHADISGGIYPLGFTHLLEILRQQSDNAEIEVPKVMITEKDPSIPMFPVVTPITLEVSKDITPIFETYNKGTNRILNVLIPELRNVLKTEFGFPFPGIRIRGNETDMPLRTALIMIDEIPEIMFEVGRDDVMVNKPVEGLAELGISGKPLKSPAIGQTHSYIAADDRADADAAGLETWDAGEYICLALRTVLQRMAPLFLDIDITWKLVDIVKHTAPELVARTVPKTVSWFELTEILQRLVDEEIGIGDMNSILEVLSQREPELRNTALLTERVRHALSRQITAKFTKDGETLSVFLLDPKIEAIISSAIQSTKMGTYYLALNPNHTEEILSAIREKMNSIGRNTARVPILTKVVEIRRYIRKLVELEFPSTHVLSCQDLQSNMKIKSVAKISLDQKSHNQPPSNVGASK